MHLEHLNLVVKDLSETLTFYAAAFPHWQVRGGGEGDWYGVRRNWIHFGDDKHYLTFNDSGTGENRDLHSNELGLSHFAYVTSNIDAVVNRLMQAGFAVAKDGANSPFRRNVYFIDPNGYEVEFVQYLSDLPEERNLFDD
jgi:catechol 2,3-dioxygenase-like lactoylglutathione lyase family enzyme